MKNLDTILEQLEELQQQVIKLKNEEENKREKDWRKTEDLLVLNCLDNKTIELSSNYVNWNKVKGKEHPLYMEMYDSRNTTVCVGFTLEQMIKIRDYLNEKIEFLSE